jgi:Uma2 family endonuclease
VSDAEFPALPVPPLGEWWSDEPPMETVQHLMSMITLISTLRWLWRDRTDYFVGGNLTVYYSQLHRKSEDFRGPDFFVALNVDGARDRKSWVVWEEGGRYPDVIVELLSDSTRANDRGEKKRIYEQIFRTPEYFLYDPHTHELEGYCLVDGRYEPIEPDARGLLPCNTLGLAFGVHDRELRFFTLDGELVQRAEEQVDDFKARAERAAVRARQAEVAAEREKVRAERAEAELAALRATLENERT